MRKRRWWFAGLALALLAACVGVWKWSERPPYLFLQEADLAYIEVDPEPGWMTFCYISRQPLQSLGQQAKGELEKPIAEERIQWHFALPLEAGIAIYDASEWRGGNYLDLPVPADAHSVVLFRHPATLADKVHYRIWKATHP